MVDTKKIEIEAFDYDLPDEKIAKFPLEKRDESKLLVYKKGDISQSVFKNIADFIPKGSLMVFNNTKVIQARLVFAKESGARIEIFCLEPEKPLDYTLAFQAKGRCEWKCLIGNAKRWKNGLLSKKIEVNGKTITLCAERLRETKGNAFVVEFSWDDEMVSYAEILDAAGQLPIPPYLHRETCEQDKVTYQTVYSKVKGSVAAPTAGLHFTDDVFRSLQEKCIDREDVTLHVGAGTFKPVKSETIGEHEMHTEFFSVRKETIEKLLEKGCGAIAVGTTSVRTLESLYYVGAILNDKCWDKTRSITVRQWMPYEENFNLGVETSLSNILGYMNACGLDEIKANTQIIIVPGYKFKIVRKIITNFHQPKSTLLLLISAYVGEDWKKIYDYAQKNNFRFLSYGDSSLLDNE